MAKVAEQYGLMKSQDEAEISGSRGTANFVWRCGHCKVRLVRWKPLLYSYLKVDMYVLRLT
jgi:hypothetical protein